MLFLLGIFCNVLFQAYTALRAAVSPGRLMAHALDGLVSVFVLAVIACVVFIVNYGELRLYILISLAMGFILSNALVGNLIYSIAFYCVNAVMEAVSQIKHAAIAIANTVNQKVLAPLISNLKKPPPPGNGGSKHDNT